MELINALGRLDAAALEPIIIGAGVIIGIAALAMLTLAYLKHK